MRAQHSELDVVPIVVRWRAHRSASRLTTQAAGSGLCHVLDRDEGGRLTARPAGSAPSQQAGGGRCQRPGRPRAPDRHTLQTGALQTVTRVASVWESTLRGLIK